LKWNIAVSEVLSVAAVASAWYCSADKETQARNGTDFNEIILKMFL
jgi:hypothetical protein